MNQWRDIERMILENDGVSRDENGKIACSDLVERLINKCVFKNRYWVTFTHPRTRHPDGHKRDHFALGGEFWYFIRGLARSQKNHILPIWAQGIPPYKTSRHHVHAVLLAENPIAPSVFKLAASFEKHQFNFKEEKVKWFGELYPKREPGEPMREYREREDAHEAEWDRIARKNRKLMRTHFGNGQSWRVLENAFEPYNPAEGGISYILHKHVQFGSRVFCPGLRRCRKQHGCLHKVPFENLTPADHKAQIISAVMSSTNSKIVPPVD